jgi:hypothetical protein
MGTPSGTLLPSTGTPSGTPSGTLLHKFQVAEEAGNLDETAAAHHIIKWIKILQRGTDAFEAAILKEQRKSSKNHWFLTS